ncbi:leucine-rich repeat domain-containing protein [Amedibacillus sp. YH-ame10]
MKDKKKKVEKILLSSTMVLAMAFSVMPANVFAQESNIADNTRAGDISIDYTNFPDSVFRDYVKNVVDTDKNYSLSQAEINAATTMAFDEGGINDFKGIEYFTALTDLSIKTVPFLKSIDLSQNTALTSLKIVQSDINNLDLSANTALKKLTFSTSRVTTLDLSANTALTYLDCSWSGTLTDLIISQNTALEYLKCDHSTNLKTLDVSKNTALTTLDCSASNLKSLDLSYNTALKELYCQRNQLTDLDVSKNTALLTLECYSNQLENLNLDKNVALTSLDCSDNQIESLDVSQNAALKELSCANNQLTDLSVDKNEALTSLDCGENQLANLDVSKNTALLSLGCYSNQLTDLNVDKNVALTDLYCSDNKLKSLNLKNNEALTSLDCSRNQLTSLDLSNYDNFDYFECSAQERTIAFIKNKGYLLSAYDAGFDKSKASNFVGATFNDNGTLTDVTLDTPITYDYDTGYVGSNGNPMDVTLTFVAATDSSRLEEAKPLAEKAIKEFGVTNSTTNKNILDAVATGISSVDDVTAIWKTGSPIITKATIDKAGSIVGTIILTSGDKSIEIAVNKVIDKLPSKTTIVDKTTGLEIGYEDGSPFAEDITLVVTPKSKEEMKEFQNNVNKVVAGKTIAGVYDIKLLKNGVEIQPNGKLKISLSLTEEMKAMSELQVVYIDDNGKVTIIPSQLIDGKLVFITDHFSYYGVIGKESSTGQIQPETPSKPTSPQTGDTTNTMLCLGLIVLSGSIVGYGVKKKKALSK